MASFLGILKNCLRYKGGPYLTQSVIMNGCGHCTEGITLLLSTVLSEMYFSKLDKKNYINS